MQIFSPSFKVASADAYSWVPDDTAVCLYCPAFLC